MTTNKDNVVRFRAAVKGFLLYGCIAIGLLGGVIYELAVQADRHDWNWVTDIRGALSPFDLYNLDFERWTPVFIFGLLGGVGGAGVKKSPLLLAPVFRKLLEWWDRQQTKPQKPSEQQQTPQSELPLVMEQLKALHEQLGQLRGVMLSDVSARLATFEAALPRQLEVCFRDQFTLHQASLGEAVASLEVAVANKLNGLEKTIDDKRVFIEQEAYGWIKELGQPALQLERAKAEMAVTELTAKLSDTEATVIKMLGELAAKERQLEIADSLLGGADGVLDQVSVLGDRADAWRESRSQRKVSSGPG